MTRRTKAGDDTLIDNFGNDAFYGGDGNDEITPTGPGNRTIDGGDGDDFIRISAGAAGVFTIQGGAGADTLHATYGIISPGSTMAGEIMPYVACRVS
ncbi:MAG: hypothetical protein ABL932_21385, partial [Terricaulis sp.]